MPEGKEEEEELKKALSTCLLDSSWLWTCGTSFTLLMRSYRNLRCIISLGLCQVEKLSQIIWIGLSVLHLMLPPGQLKITASALFMWDS